VVWHNIEELSLFNKFLKMVLIKRHKGSKSFCYLECLVLNIQAVINLQFNTLVFFTFPEKQSDFESHPTRKNEETDKCLEAI